MRTTIRLDDELLKELKLLAVGSGKSLTSVIEDALRQSLGKQRQIQKSEPVELLTVPGKGLQPGVDLDDYSALVDLMDKSDGPA